MTRISSRSSLALVLAALALAAGCGGDDEVDAACVDRAMQRAEYDVLAEAFRDGELGTPEQVRHESLSLEDTPGFEPKAFVGRDGKMIPFDELDQDQLMTLRQWHLASKSVPSNVHSRAEVAELDAKERAQEDCS